jgi:hypothetical protein
VPTCSGGARSPYRRRRAGAARSSWATLFEKSGLPPSFRHSDKSVTQGTERSMLRSNCSPTPA